MKHVRESLKQFDNYKFFSLFEEAETDKETLKTKEKDGLAIVDKVTSNFDDFKKDADGVITRYKEFWEENQTTKKGFSEAGELYKLFDDDYVVGVLELPVETASDGSVVGGLGASDEPEEEIIEGKEVPEGAGKPKQEFFEEQQVPGVANEAEEAEDDLGLDLDLNLDDEPTDAPDETPTDQPVEEPAESPEAPLETPETPAPDLTGPQKYLVVYDLSGGEREEIFRCGSNNVVKAFNAFYNDTFKGAMKDIINQYKEQKQVEKTEAEKAEKAKAEQDKQSKVQKFLGKKTNENLNEDTISDIENNKYDPQEVSENDDFDQWLAQVAEYLHTDFEIESEDLEMFMDIVMDELEDLYEEDINAFDASASVAANEEAWEELKTIRGEEGEDLDTLEDDEDDLEDDEDIEYLEDEEDIDSDSDGWQDEEGEWQYGNEKPESLDVEDEDDENLK